MSGPDRSGRELICTAWLGRLCPVLSGYDRPGSAQFGSAGLAWLARVLYGQEGWARNGVAGMVGIGRELYRWVGTCKASQDRQCLVR